MNAEEKKYILFGFMGCMLKLVFHVINYKLQNRGATDLESKRANNM